MASAEAPHLVEGELETTLEDAFLSIDRQLLTDELRQDPITNWVFEWRTQTPLSGLRASQRLPLSMVTNQFANQVLQLLIPFYLMTLRTIGHYLQAVEQLIAQIESAMQLDNLEESVRLTREHIAALKDPSPSESLLLQTALTTPDVLRDALRETLAERLRAYIVRQHDIHSCWELWRAEVITVKDHVDQLQFLAIEMDFRVVPPDEARLMATISPALNAPSSLPSQLADLGIATPRFPNEYVSALLNALPSSISRAIVDVHPENNSSLASWLTASEGNRTTPLTIVVYRESAIQANRTSIAAAAQGNTQAFDQIRALFRIMSEREAASLTTNTELRRRLLDNRYLDKIGLSRRVRATLTASRRESTAVVNAVITTFHDLLARGDEADILVYEAPSANEVAASTGTPYQPPNTAAPSARSGASFSHGLIFGASNQKDDDK